LFSQVSEFMRKVQDESEYKEIPGRVEGCEVFIDLVEKLADDFGICYEVLRKEGHVTAKIYHLGINFGEFPARLGELIAMADAFDTMAAPNHEGYVEIDLTYRTHDHYVSGKLRML